MRTFVAKPNNIKSQWLLIDAKDKVLGRLAADIAAKLRGKHKPSFTPNIDTGDYVIVVNTDKMLVTGDKKRNKMYYRYTGYIGNLKSFSYSEMMEKDSTRVLYLAVKGMLPRGPLGRTMLKKLNLYRDSEHKHYAQQPTVL